MNADAGQRCLQTVTTKVGSNINSQTRWRQVANQINDHGGNHKRTLNSNFKNLSIRSTCLQSPVIGTELLQFPPLFIVFCKTKEFWKSALCDV